MISFKRTRQFAFLLLLIAILLIQILTFVEGRGVRNSFRMRRPVNRPIYRTPVRRPIYRAPVRRPIYRPPPVHRPPTHTTTIHHPVSNPSGGKISSKNFIHTEGGGRPKPMNTANNNHVQVTLPKLPPRPNAPPISSLQKPQQRISSKPIATNVAKPYKPPASVQTHNSNAVKPPSSSAGSSSSHSSNSASKPQTVSKPSVPMKDPSSSSTPYKPPQTTRAKPNEGSSSNKINDHSKPIITAKPSAPYEPANKVTSTNVQSASKPLVTNPDSYPAWANPNMKTPGNSKPLPSPPGNSVSSSGTPIGGSSPPIKPYKPESIQVKPNQGQSSSSGSSSKPVASAGKPLTGAVPQKPYQASSQSSASSSSSKPSKTNEAMQTQGSSSKPVSSANKPLTGPVPQKPYQPSSQSSASSSKPSKTNEAMQTQGTSGAASNSGSSMKPLGSSASKPSAPSSSNTPSTTNQAQPNPGTAGSITNGHPNNKPLPEIPAAASQSTVSNSGASTHHELPSAPMSSGFHPHSGYPGVMPNHPMGSGYYPPPNSYSMSNVMSHGNGGDGGSGMDRLFKESLVSSLVNEAVHRVIHGPQNYHNNFDYRPLNPESYQPPPYRSPPGDSQSAPPTEGHTTINNHYYFDPNATNTNQGLPVNQQTNSGNTLTNVQPTESASPAATIVSNTNSASTVTQESSKNDAEATKIEQPAVMQPNVESVEENSSVSTENETEAVPPPVEPTIIEIVPIGNDELWKLTESMFANEMNISQYVALNLQNSEADSVEPVEATEPLIYVQKEANLLPTIKALRDLFDNYEFDAEITESTNSEKEEEEGALLDEFLKTEAMIEAMQLLTDRGYIKSGQWKDTLQHLWMKRFNDAMSGFERIFLAEKYPNSLIFGGQNWIYFDHQEQSKRIKYMNYRNSLNLGDNAQLLKVNYKFDDVVQNKAMLVGTSPHLEMALYTVCHFVKPNDWCTVSLGDAKFGIFTHAFMNLEKPMLDLGYLDF